MKARSLLSPAASGFILVLILLAVLKGNVTALEAVVRVPSAPAAELHVCPVGPPDCDYTTIQAAVQATSSGDIIKVATGVYTDVHAVRLAAQEYVTQVVYLTGTITIRGGYTTTNWTTSEPITNPTTLDAKGQGRVLYVAGGAAATVEGLHITGGDAIKGDTTDPVAGSGEKGGGMYAVEATVAFRNNHVFDNTASAGGGLFLRAGEIELSGNTISSNTARNAGGAYYSEGLGKATLSGNTFRSNTATGPGPTPGRGGGLLLFRSGPATLSNNAFISNTAGDGGGLYLDESDITLVNNVVADNSSTVGSGLYIKESSPLLFHTAIVRNSGNQGVYVVGGSQVELVNTILSTQTMGIDVAEDGSQASLNATLWYANTVDWSGGVSHTGDRIGDPDFVDPEAGDYHISNVSAALDQGVYVGVNVDMDGDVRPRGHGYDIGPDEYPDFLSVVKEASPIPARAGEQLIYAIRIANYGGVTYTAIITDTLPDHVIYNDGTVTWISETILPGPEQPWIGYITVTVEAGYTGFLTNTVEVVGIYEDERETGAARHVTASFAVYLPLALRTS
jgi:uncharacterized repeat protein (TIGR01451 family)